MAELKPGLKLGYKASAEQFAPRELVELAVAAEAHGMDSATVSDHFQPWRHEGGHAPFSLAWMTAVGERTERLIDAGVDLVVVDTAIDAATHEWALAKMVDTVAVREVSRSEDKNSVVGAVIVLRCLITAASFGLATPPRLFFEARLPNDRPL